MWTPESVIEAKCRVKHGLSTLPVCLVICKLALTSAEIIDHAASANDDDDDDTPQDSGAREQGSNLIGTSTSGARSSVFALDNMLAPA